jgi:alanyl-tRNA synthetase
MDSYHLTSFEMLGSWSLSSYWKERTIELAYNYLISLGIKPNQMYITYFEGNDMVPADLETYEIWKRYLPENRIIGGNQKDNFWMMAETGPCGCSTEIHLDISGIDRNCPELVNQDDPQVIEVWNNVFMEYEIEIIDGIKVCKKLTNHYVDTGMGLERLAMVLQKKQSVYQTDCFHYLMGYRQSIVQCGESLF